MRGTDGPPVASTDHRRRMAALFDLVAPDYDQHVPFFTEYAKLFVPWVGVGRGQLVLDIGTGRGALARQVRRRRASAVGVDIAAEMLRRSPTNACLMDALCLGFPDEVFDVTLGAFSIHLLADPSLGVSEDVRVLRPGGTFALLLGGRSGSPRWDFYTDLLRRAGAQSQGEARMPPVVPFGDPHSVLEAAGLVDIEVSECEVHVPVADGETFLRGELSHGYRSLFDALPPGPRRELQRELLDHLEAMRGDGGIVLDRVATCAKGAKRVR